MLEQHVDKDADITIACRALDDLTENDKKTLGIVEIDQDSRIVDFREKPLNPCGNLGSMGIYIMKRRFLIELIQDSAAKGYADLVMDIIIEA